MNKLGFLNVSVFVDKMAFWILCVRKEVKICYLPISVCADSLGCSNVQDLNNSKFGSCFNVMHILEPT